MSNFLVIGVKDSALSELQGAIRNDLDISKCGNKAIIEKFERRFSPYYIKEGMSSEHVVFTEKQVNEKKRIYRITRPNHDSILGAISLLVSKYASLKVLVYFAKGDEDETEVAINGTKEFTIDKLEYNDLPFFEEGFIYHFIAKGISSKFTKGRD